jgi:hypothetical protein
VDIFVRAGYQFLVDRCYLYYTVDGSAIPKAHSAWARHDEGGRGRLGERRHSSAARLTGGRRTIPASANTTMARRSVTRSRFHNSFVLPVSDALDAKRYGMTTFAITNFNPTTATVWTHNNRNTNHTATGLSEGLHIVRARSYLPRDGKSGVYNTFLQTFYYDAVPPTGAIAFPATDRRFDFQRTYVVVIRADSSVTGVEVNVQDSNALNDDAPPVRRTATVRPTACRASWPRLCDAHAGLHRRCIPNCRRNIASTTSMCPTQARRPSP